jgi:DNA-binding MarR family transcriptional regulator
VGLERPRDARVSLPEYRILVLIEIGAVTAPSALADELRVSRPAVAQIVGRLARKGLVRRRTAGTERRRALLSVTPRGRAVVEAVVRERAQLLRPALGELSARERSQLLRSLTRLERALASSDSSQPGVGRGR